MDADVFAEWLRRIGHSVIKTKSSYWYDAGPKIYQAFPYHWEIEPSQDEIFDLIRKHHIVGLRYSTSLNSREGCISYHAVCYDSKLALNCLNNHARKNVRIGLRDCRVEIISFEHMAEDGYELAVDTARRQGRRINLSRDLWRQRHLAASDLPGFEVWGALFGNRLVASILAFQCDDCWVAISFQSHRDFLKKRVNNALYFIATKAALSRTGVRRAFGGLHSLDAPESVDEFKMRLGYRAKAVRQRVVFHPWLRPFNNTVSYSLVKSLHRISAGSVIFSKAEGMLRFGLQGKLPLSEQEHPRLLREYMLDQ